MVNEADFAAALDHEMQQGAALPPAHGAVSEPSAAPQPAPRMLSVQDLPPVARQQVAQAAAPATADAGPVGGLFRRIANGFGGGADDTAELQQAQARLAGAGRAPAAPAAPAAMPAPAAAHAPAPAQAPASLPAASGDPRMARAQDDSPYAPSRNAALDGHGRPAPRALSEEEQLDIPAFLRRNAG